MNTCKFFLQGTCKYGDNCKFSHQITDISQSQGTSIMRQNAVTPQIDTNVLIKSVVNDMTNAEKGGHWLLSSYAPFKDKPCFPGFENRSFEEVRYAYYEAMKTGTVEQYKQQLQHALQDAAMKMKTLQNPSSEIIAMLIQIYYDLNYQNNTSGTYNPAQSNPGFQPNFNQNQPQSIFALANQELLGKTATNQQQSMFRAAPTNTNPNLFSTSPPQNQNLFSASQSIFNKPFVNTMSNSIFSNQNYTTATTKNPFGPQTNTFTTQNSMFSNNQSSNTFTTNSMFNPQTQVSPFQNPPANNAPFNQTISKAPFSQPISNAPFHQPVNNAPFSQPINNPPFSQQVNNPPFSQAVNNSPFSQPVNAPFNQPVNNAPFNKQLPTIDLQPQVSLFQNQLSNNKPFNNTNQSGNNPVFASPTQPVNSPAFSPLGQSFNFAQAAAANIPPVTYGPATQPPSIFAKSPTQQNISPFQQQPPTNGGNSVFNAQPANPNMFRAPTSLFSNQLAPTQPSNPSSVFEQTVMPNRIFGGSTETTDGNAYSKLEDLSETEIKSFQNENFEFGKIPEKPPTAQMCN